MTKKTKQKKEKTEKEKITEEGKKAVAEALVESRKPQFGKRIAKLFYGTIYFSTMGVFALIFSLVAILVLPILLPFSYLYSAFKGKGIKVHGIS
tara:strand:- start:931 stop:1212 length:282 start_codon:yes stop_codon:yes gene_type:complete